MSRLLTKEEVLEILFWLPTSVNTDEFCDFVKNEARVTQDSLTDIKRNWCEYDSTDNRVNCQVDYLLVPTKEVRNNTDRYWYCSYCGFRHDKLKTPIFRIGYDDDPDSQSDICLFRKHGRNNDIFRCSCCGTLLPRWYMDAHNAGVCCRCIDDRDKYKIKRYNYKPRRMLYYDCIDGVNKEVPLSEFKGGYGIELEIDGAGENNNNSEDAIKLLNNEAYSKHDGSLRNGFEIVTYPHTEKALRNLPFETLFKQLIKLGYRSHEPGTCGLHMHISRTLFADDGAIVNLIEFYDNHYDDIVRVARRQRSSADRWAGKANYWDGNSFDYEEYFENVNQCGDHDCRYKAVNIINQATVEIRIMRGTLNIKSFWACLDFIITTARNSNNNPRTLEDWFKGMQPETLEYIAQRGAFGYGDPKKVDENMFLDIPSSYSRLGRVNEYTMDDGLGFYSVDPSQEVEITQWREE